MNYSEYADEVMSDAEEYIEQALDWDVDRSWDEVREEILDSVSGNSDGSYTFNAAQAQEYVSDLVFDDQFLSTLEENNISIEELLAQGPEAVDVTARYLAFFDVEQYIQQSYEEEQEFRQENSLEKPEAEHQAPAEFACARLAKEGSRARAAAETLNSPDTPREADRTAQKNSLDLASRDDR